MKEYIIHAFDGTDVHALEHRLSVRPAHFKNMSLFKASGNFVYGGAMLDAEGKMIGSTVVMRFESDDAFQAYLDSEPYISEKVWQDIKIYPFRLATVPMGWCSSAAECHRDGRNPGARRVRAARDIRRDDRIGRVLTGFRPADCRGCGGRRFRSGAHGRSQLRRDPVDQGRGQA